MLPWTWSIAYRRFNQGVLIRFGHSIIVGQGTFVRLAADLIVLLIGYFIGSVPGIVVATAAVASGVISEAIFIGIKVKPVIDQQLRLEPEVNPPLTKVSFLRYYIPLALTSLITLLSQPLISTALSRMPMALDSLAIWPVLTGLLFIFRAPGIAYNEVVVTLLDNSIAFRMLRKFAAILTAATSVLLFLITVTPLSSIWFMKVTALPSTLITLGKTALWFSLLIPGANALQSWYQGILLHSGKTKGITQAVSVFLLVTIGIYTFGIMQDKYPGIFIGTLGFSLGMACQAAWLKYKTNSASLEFI